METDKVSKLIFKILSNSPQDINKIHSFNMYIKASNIAKKMHLNRKILIDIGCSRGYGTRLLGDILSEWTIIGVDINGDSITYAKQAFEYGNVFFYKIDITKFKNVQKIQSDFSKASIITCFEVYEHLSKEIAEKFLKGIKQIIHKNGLLIISSPNREIYDIQSYTPGHINEIIPSEFKRSVQKVGFSIKEIYGIEKCKKSFIKILKSLNINFKDGCKKSYIINFKIVLVAIIRLITDRSYFPLILIRNLNTEKYLEMKLKIPENISIPPSWAYNTIDDFKFHLYICRTEESEKQ